MLDERIAEWRAYLSRRQAIEAVDVDELEDHLRNQVSDLQAAGLDEEEAFRRVGDPEIEAQLAAQDAAMAGEKGAKLWAVSAADGEKLAEHPLEAMPVFDGLIAAGGRLYLVTADGNVLCFGPQ